jgi:gamma-glutamyl hydrolase
MHNNSRFDNYTSYIMATFVVFMESAGARVIPFINGEPEDVALDKLNRVNGVLFPGGDGDYLEYGRFLFNKIKEINDNGTYLPAWGTCMGYENFAVYASDEGQSVIQKYVMYTTSLPLTFVVDPRET